MTEDHVASYLAQTPDFFERHAHLLAQVQLSSPHGNRAVSLHERQAEMLREKIRTLEHRIMDMVRHGTENVAAADRLLRWTCSLLNCREPAEMPRTIAQGLQVHFAVPQTGIKLWDLDPAYAGQDYAQQVSDDLKALATSLVSPYVGMNSGFEAASWLADPQQAVSLALIPLRHQPGPEHPAFGLLVLASPDPQRYTGDMGTDFLERIAHLSSAALTRLRPLDA